MRKSKQAHSLIYNQNESMLVSQRKPLINIPSQQHNNKKQNINKNTSCDCNKRITALQNKLEMLSLNMDEMASHVNISFTKHMQSYAKFIDEQKKRENVQHVIWEIKRDNQNCYERYTQQLRKSNDHLSEIQEQVQMWVKTLRELKSWKNSCGGTITDVQKQIREEIKTYKNDNQNTLKKMYQAIEQIGVLQRKMLLKNQNITMTQPTRQSRAMSTKQRYSVGGKKYSMFNQSTMIASRQNY